jgi:hypothetical protein
MTYGDPIEQIIEDALRAANIKSIRGTNDHPKGKEQEQ